MHVHVVINQNAQTRRSMIPHNSAMDDSIGSSKGVTGLRMHKLLDLHPARLHVEVARTWHMHLHFNHKTAARLLEGVRACDGGAPTLIV